MILSLETSTPVCSIALHNEGKLLARQAYHSDKSHSVLLPSIIGEILDNALVKKNDLQAVAISAGPGSYTGLRIGLSTTKGLCFALGIPLISVGTLDTLIAQAKNWTPSGALICPMLDARRMEVYTKLVKATGEQIWELQPLILEEDTFQEYSDKSLYLFGSGAAKCRDFLKHPNLIIVDDIHPDAAFTGKIAWEKFKSQEFEDLAYYEPNYLKEFQTKKASNKLLS
ncbi:MAG: tRNA (adenosine(37)-N6)-threonylcarbamoyltransferase complex dimerization subunit type 1 TsaB [Cytophagales bacterium]|nr:tRNA (adenosine(37)-N6)-threonylcarbamoyltransferase complex dimerization subunit type 1 TsaB [Cytophagales bacterium]